MELVRPAPAAALSAAGERSQIVEDEFRLLYDRTARPLRAYLYRMLRDISRADDLLQETYLRFLQARLPGDMTDEHRKNYLFRIATNLLHNEAHSRQSVPLTDYPSATDVAADVQKQSDTARHFAQLTPRQRELLWLAYVETFTHKEIAGMIGVGVASIGPMLSRARDRFSEILKAGGFKRR